MWPTRTVFNLAREDVQQRINYSGTEKKEWTIEPTYTISVGHTVMDENEMANAILSSASDEISTGTALYLDGELTAVCADGSSLRGYISSLLEPYEDQENSNVTVGLQQVRRCWKRASTSTRASWIFRTS